MNGTYDLDNAIRKVPDFPKEGILFYDITSILTNPEAFSYCIDRMVDIYSERKIDAVAAVEARGFLFASPFVVRTKKPLLLVRKEGKLPGEKLSKRFSLEYGEDVIQIHKQDIPKGGTVLIVDDLIATGGTLRATKELLEEAGATVTDIFSVVGLPFLKFKEMLPNVNITTLVEYHGE